MRRNNHTPPSRGSLRKTSGPRGWSSQASSQQDQSWSETAAPSHGPGQPPKRDNALPKGSVIQPLSSRLIRRGSPRQHGLDDEDDGTGYHSQDQSDDAGMNTWDMSGLGRWVDDDDGQGSSGSQYDEDYGDYGSYEDEQRALSAYSAPPTNRGPAAGRNHPSRRAEGPQWSRRQSGMRSDLRSRDAPSLGLWKNLAMSPGGTIPERHQMSPGLRLLFGLDDTLPDNLRPQSPSSGAVLPSNSNTARSCSLSHQGAWDLMVMMDESRGSLEASSAKQRTSGPILTLTPPASINRRTVCPLQMKFKGTGAICDSDANIFCADLGVDGLLDKLNHVFGTNYSLDKIPNLEALLDEMVNDESNYDFGYAYGRVRRGWFCDVDYLHERLNGHAEADSGRRQRAIDDDLIIDPRVPPRRVWDLYSNRVLPFHVLLGADVPRNLWAISHSWVPDSQLQRVWTRINSCMWPVPIPLSVYLSQIRIELLNLGAEYVWLDALCLRQEIPPTTMLNYPYRDTVDSQWLRRREKTRREEWRLDVPTIGYVYRCRPSQVVVTYFNGLGRPFRLSANSKSAWGIANTNHWINRVWTMQEATPNWLLGGLTLQPFDDNEPGLWDTITLFHQRMSDLLAVLPQGYTPPDLFALVTFLRLRHSRRENDYISGLGYLLQCPVIPIYDETISAETAWKRLVRELDPKFLTDLLFLFPVPGADRRARWRPSWKQLLRHPLTPRSTPPVSYLQQDLVQYDPASDVFSNVAYVVDRCVFHPTETAGSLEVEVLIGPRDGEQAKSWSFTIIVNCTSPSLETDTEYTIVATADLKYWLYGNTVNETSGSLTFQKLGIFDVDDAEDMDRLWHLNPGYADMRVIYA